MWRRYNRPLRRPFRVAPAFRSRGAAAGLGLSGSNGARSQAGLAGLSTHQRRPFADNEWRVTHERCHDARRFHRLQGRRHHPGRLGPPRADHRRIGNARTDGPAPQVCRPAAAERREDPRLHPHDHPDRRADRDPGRAGRRSPLVELQHLLHPGPGRRRHRRSRHPGVRLEGRDRGRVRMVHRADHPQGRPAVGRQHGAGRRR